MYSEVKILFRSEEKELMIKFLEDVGINREKLAFYDNIPESNYVIENLVFSPTEKNFSICINCSHPNKTHQNEGKRPVCMKIINNTTCPCIKFIST